MNSDIPEISIRVARRIMQEMFAVKAKQVVAITTDSGSDRVLAQAFFDACQEVDAKPIVLHTPRAANSGQAGMDDWPADALVALLKTVDVWLETNASFMLYSNMWEEVMRENPKIRYNILAGSSVESLDRVFCHFNIGKMDQILQCLAGMAKTTQRVRVTTARGTDISFETDPNHLIDYDSGDFTAKSFCTAPGYLNLVPKSGTMEGNLVFDMIMHADLSQGGHVEFEMRQGSIVGFKGDKSHFLKDYIQGFNEENMSKISHMMLGLCPGVRELSWEIVEDERVWGGCNFGFGHTSPIDMPPLGQPAASHFDGITQKATVWFDETLVVDDGNIVLPAIQELVADLLAEYDAAVSTL